MNAVTDIQPDPTPDPGPPPAATDRPLVEVENLRISFDTDEGVITPVDGVSFSVAPGQTLGIVGESGSGKSVSTRALMKLLPKNAIIDPASRLLFRPTPGEEIDIAPLDPKSREIRRIRGGQIAMIFQEPMASFSPVYTIGNQISEAVRLHRGLVTAGRGPLAVTEPLATQFKEILRSRKPGIARDEAEDIALEMLKKVGLSNAELRLRQFPHELSGGMRQRAMIAVALSTNPKLLIADEPTTALDVTIQAQILALINDLRRDIGMSVLFITHDMGVIAQVADTVAVMYLGQVVERGPTRALIEDPRHPYTQGLLQAIPRIDRLDRRLQPVGGDIPSPLERPSGCTFHPRCPKAKPGLCDRTAPAETRLGPDRFVRCILAAEEAGQ